MLLALRGEEPCAGLSTPSAAVVTRLLRQRDKKEEKENRDEADRGGVGGAGPPPAA